MKDYSNFYATTAQVIPVLILVFVIEARGFGDVQGQRLRPSLQRWNLLCLLLALAGMFFAIVALAQGSPVSDYMLIPVVAGAFGGFYLAGQGVLVLIGRQLGWFGASEDSTTDS